MDIYYKAIYSAQHKVWIALRHTQNTILKLFVVILSLLGIRESPHESKKLKTPLLVTWFLGKTSFC